MLSGSSSDILDLAATIAWCHHERFDGRGYPRGLAGTEIPLEGRIAAIADVFDALTCDRAYRRALSPDEAISWMTCQRGKHFDPGVLTPTSDMSKTPMTTDARPAGHRAGRSDAGGRLRSSRNRPGAIRNARRKLGPEVLAEASRSGSCVAWLDGAATERAIARNVRPIATGPRSTADKGDVPVL